MRIKHLVLLGSLAGSGLACDPPTHPHRFAETIFANACRYNFECCTPNEREFGGLSGLGGSALNEEECREELNDQFGGIFAAAAQAVDDGRATYDAEAASRCTREMQAAFDSCDSQTLLGNIRNDSSRLLFLFDGSDQECIALAQRAWTRGVLDDGDACSSDVECEDFGVCNFDDAKGVGFEIDSGTCTAPAGSGEACTERRCGLGLVCDGAVCAPENLADNGAACISNSECESTFCTALSGECSSDGDFCVAATDCFTGFCEDGRCDDSGDDCTVDADCTQTCSATPGTCEALPSIDVEICNGQ